MEGGGTGGVCGAGKGPRWGRTGGSVGQGRAVMGLRWGVWNSGEFGRGRGEPWEGSVGVREVPGAGSLLGMGLLGMRGTRQDLLLELGEVTELGAVLVSGSWVSCRQQSAKLGGFSGLQGARWTAWVCRSSLGWKCWREACGRGILRGRKGPLT